MTLIEFGILASTSMPVSIFPGRYTLELEETIQAAVSPASRFG